MKKFFQSINKFDLVVSLYIFCILVAEMMGAKTTPLFKIGAFKLSATVTIFLIPFVYAINDAIIEVYGGKRARSVYRSGLIMIILLVLFSIIAVKLPASDRFKSSEASYELIFGQSIRIAVASLTAFALGDLIDIIIFEIFTKRLGKKVLWFRSNMSNFISEFIDTVIFMTLAFYSLDKSFSNNFSFLIGLITPYWLLKCCMSIIETPLLYVAVRWLKQDKV